MANCGHCGLEDATLDHVAWCRNPERRRSTLIEARNITRKWLLEAEYPDAPEITVRLTIVGKVPVTCDLVDLLVECQKALSHVSGFEPTGGAWIE